MMPYWRGLRNTFVALSCFTTDVCIAIRAVTEKDASFSSTDICIHFHATDADGMVHTPDKATLDAWMRTGIQIPSEWKPNTLVWQDLVHSFKSGTVALRSCRYDASFRSFLMLARLQAKPAVTTGSWSTISSVRSLLRTCCALRPCKHAHSAQPAPWAP